MKFTIDFDGILHTVETCLGDEPHTHLISSIQGRELYLCDLVKKNEHFNIGLYSGIYRLISFKLGIMIESTKLYILDDHDRIQSFKVTVVWAIRNFSMLYLRKFAIHVDDIEYVGFLKLMLNLLCTSTIQGRELC